MQSVAQHASQSRSQPIVCGSRVMLARGASQIFTASPMKYALAGFIAAIAHSADASSVMTQHVREVVRQAQVETLGRMPAAQRIKLDVVLPLRNADGLKALLAAQYDPASVEYHHYLKPQEFIARFGAPQTQYEALRQYALQHGLSITGGSFAAMDLQVEGRVADIEKAFAVELNRYHDPIANRDFYAADREPTTALSFPLWHVSGLDNYALPKPQAFRKPADVSPQAATGSGPSASFLGSDLRAAYYGGTALTGAGQVLGLLEYVGTDLDDLNTYYHNVGQTNTVPITLLSVDGTPVDCLAADGCDDYEPSLDLTQALGMAPGLSSLVMYVGTLDTALLGAMTSANPLPATIGSSWTWEPADPTTLDPYFERMAAQGQTFFNASGDYSTWRRRNNDWPADDAYVVAVGGTDLQTTGAAGAWQSETAWKYSGGGVSPNDIPIPSWQQLTGVVTRSNKASKDYRNGPDVAANANFTFYTCNNQTTCEANAWGGTSFATPMWAAYLALINEKRAQNGQPTAGLITPTLYSIGVSTSYASNLHDITSGKSGIYTAMPGFDLVTGWGSPNAGLIDTLSAPTN